MADLFANAYTSTDKFLDAADAIGAWEKDFPHIADVLRGKKPGKGEAGRMPGSIRLFSNARELKCELSGEAWLMRAYLTLPKGVMSLEAIEKELAEGRLGWAVKGERKNSYGELPH